MTETPQSNKGSASEICEQFCQYADHVHGTYLDATVAMGGMAAWYMNMDRERWKQLEESKEPLTWDVFNPEIVYQGSVRGKDGDLHRARLHDVIFRNSPNGGNWQFLALMCVVGLYQIWDEHFRAEMGTALGKEAGDLRADVFGEVRHLRNSIIHRNGLASAAVARARLTRAFAEDSPIILAPQDLHDIVDLVKEAARSFVEAQPPTP